MSITIQVVEKVPRLRQGYGGQAAAVLVVPASKNSKERVAWGKAEFRASGRRERAAFVATVGLGEHAELTSHMEGLRRGVGRTVAEARRRGVREMVIDLTGATDSVDLARAAVEAVYLTDYVFAEHKKSLAKEQRAKSLQRVLIAVKRGQAETAKLAVVETQRIMAAVKETRDLVNQPASHLLPSTLVEQARALVKRYPTLELKVMNRAEAEADGWHAFLAVARGSEMEPYVIHLIYRVKPRRGEATRLRPKKVVLVGKGITFDSGGLSLKPAIHMEDMKIDMAGAATVLSVMSLLPALQVPVEVHAIIATCENMPSGNAYRPGDILHSRSGKTIEIGNTDAEGRVTLADALDYAQEIKADAVVDLATLTGACMVALGETYAGLFSNNGELSRALLAAARWAGEGLEDLPLPDEYKQHVESKVADVTNAPANNPLGGAITAALFLQEFAGKTPWAHVDIAAPVHMSKSIIPYWAYGATGYGVRTLVEFLKEIGKKTPNPNDQ